MVENKQLLKRNLEEEKELKKEIAEEIKEQEIREEEKKNEEKKSSDKKEINDKIKKNKAIAKGISLRISTKHSKYILKIIKGKRIEDAIKMLGEVIEFKRAVPMYGREIPHRKGIMSGRYPLNASKEIMKVLKQLRSNAENLGIENPYISLAMANIASRPYKRDRTRGKRTHIYLEAKEFLGGEK
ncbi:MAG: uL22 family ribosomal protein [Candidatus Pacearchaeota archaeon]